MKIYLFATLWFVFCSLGFSQIEVFKDTVPAIQLHKQNVPVRINCYATLNSKKAPLFIIDGVAISIDSISQGLLDPKNILSINVLKGSQAISIYGIDGTNGVIEIVTKAVREQKATANEYPFKLFHLDNENWTLPQDIYNAIRAKVPSVSVATTGLGERPSIRMRGDDNTLVIVDGVQYDAAILNTLNPSDIESVTVAPNTAAANYLRNN
ncbi:hypothetical protein FGM00_08685 [Aggregatimonas sangjinii]|uniref:TonB-dependent receptor plug domain-containing protein n=1 Tax=Aggregatimonas sangjinii TaxID=2583587 RepID=A0A5B7SS85_9FLAO|nr:TonB-dependent receptor plug domain-containing protein [Aggregatimonas sangjinii]QCX00179.1 hypothetical protein FGM00_08685 [Aggregatimonas sangjinii]